MLITTRKSAESTINMSLQMLLLVIVFVSLSVFPHTTSAISVGGSICYGNDCDEAGAGGGGNYNANAIEEVFCNVVSILTGTTGKAVATVAIIAVGIGALLGKISWGMSMIVALGVALIFGAASIVNALGGGGSTCGYTQSIIAY